MGSREIWVSFDPRIKMLSKAGGNSVVGGFEKIACPRKKLDEKRYVYLLVFNIKTIFRCISFNNNADNSVNVNHKHTLPRILELSAKTLKLI